MLGAGFLGAVATPVAASAPATWQQEHPATSPPSRFGGSVAYDASTNQMLLFGGESSLGVSLSDTWVWDGANWTQLTPVHSPPARAFGAMAYDDHTGQLILFGSGASVLTDTWLWTARTGSS